MTLISLEIVLDNEKKSIVISEDKTIQDLKEKIAEEFNLDEDSFTLSLKGNPAFEFDNNQFLEYCPEIEDECVINVVRSPTPTVYNIGISFEGKPFQETYSPTTPISSVFNDVITHFQLDKTKLCLSLNNKFTASYSPEQARFDLTGDIDLSWRKQYLSLLIPILCFVFGFLFSRIF